MDGYCSHRPSSPENPPSVQHLSTGRRASRIFGSCSTRWKDVRERSPLFVGLALRAHGFDLRIQLVDAEAVIWKQFLAQVLPYFRGHKLLFVLDATPFQDE